jgi:hypothetical protein
MQSIASEESFTVTFELARTGRRTYGIGVTRILLTCINRCAFIGTFYQSFEARSTVAPVFARSGVFAF